MVIDSAMSTLPSPTADGRLSLVPSEDELALRVAVHEIASRFGPDYYRAVTAEGRSPSELWQALGSNGFLSVHLPTEYGGGGRGMLELAAILEETAAAGCPLLFMVVSPGIIGNTLAKHGTVAQKERWLFGIASAETRVAFAITEPDAGSNTQTITTSARRSANGYVISGQKYYISGVEDSQHILVVTRTGTDEKTGRGLLSLFMVDSDAPGITKQMISTACEMPEKQWTLFFDDVEVPADNLIGEENKGLRVAFDGLNPERILVAALATGIARYAMDKACAYARDRAVWGVPIATHQAISHPLAEGKILLEQARLMNQKAAALFDAGMNAGEASNMAKFAAADAALFCLDHAIQTHGGNGLALDYGLSSYWFLARTLKTAPVSREMILNNIAEHTLKLPRSF